MQLLVELADCTASYREVASKRDQMLQAIESNAWAVKVLERAKAVATAAKQVAQRVENNQHLLRRSSSDGCNNPSSVVEGMVALATKLGVPKEHPHLQDAWNLAVELRLAEIQHVLQAEQLRAVRAAGGVDRGEAHA